MTADRSMNVIIHGAFKRDMARFENALARFPAGSTSRAAELGRAWQFLTTELHHHHESEETHFFEVFRALGGTDRLLTELKGEHADMLRALDAADMAMRTLRDDPSADHAAAALTAVTALRDTFESPYRARGARVRTAAAGQLGRPSAQTCREAGAPGARSGRRRPVPRLAAGRCRLPTTPLRCARRSPGPCCSCSASSSGAAMPATSARCGSERSARSVVELEAAPDLVDEVAPVVTIDGRTVEHGGVDVELAERDQFVQQFRAARRRLAQVIVRVEPGVKTLSSSTSASDDHHSSWTSWCSLAMRQ